MIVFPRAKRGMIATPVSVLYTYIITITQSLLGQKKDILALFNIYAIDVYKP